MSINTHGCFKTICYRQSFDSTPANASGQTLRIHHTIIMGHGSANQRIRFLHAAFNSSGTTLAASNHLGNIYIFDFAVKKYWLLVHVNCCFIKFVTNTRPAWKDVLYVGITSGDVNVINSHTGQQISCLVGHKTPVTDISFSESEECLTFGNNEAILWNMESYTKLQVLQLEEGAVLKFVMFIPVTNDVIACFNDETVQIWKAKTHEPIQQIERNIKGNFNKLIIRSIAFTSNGKLMAIVGHSPTIFVFNVETLQLLKEFNFTDMSVTVKRAQFLPNLFDDGINKILTFLTSSGTLFFYDMQSELFLSKLNVNEEIWKYAIDPSCDKIATISKCGDVQIHSLGFLLTKFNRGKVVRKLPNKNSCSYKTKRKVSKKKSNDMVNKQLSDVLDTKKLKAILKEFGEYPQLYRTLIWRHLLGLPNDEAQYSAIASNNTQIAFTEFEKHYPLDVKQDMKSLRRFSENLFSWCPFLSVVSYLPVLIFPFVKYLQNEPVMCFETLITIIVNYCQFWFEYHPVPPLNILGLVESLIIQQDIELMNHFKTNEVTSKTYAWFILQSMFSEVLSSANWLIFCDHLITNSPAFLPIAVAAFSLVNRAVLLNFDNIEDFDTFYRSNNSVDFKKFIAKCYKLLNNKAIENHPTMYLKNTITFENGKYPVFDQFPKNCLEVCRNINSLRTEVNLLKTEGQSIDTKMMEMKKLKYLEKASEDYLRHMQLNKLYCNTLEEEQQNVAEERKRLECLRSQMLEKEEDLLKSQLVLQSYNHHHNSFDNMLDTLQCAAGNEEFSKIEEHLLKHYTNLLKHKIQIEGLIDEDAPLDFVQLKKSYKQISDEINKVQSKMTVPSKEYLKQLNIVTGLAAVDGLIRKVESKISERSTTSDKSKIKGMVSKLAKESEELSHEINKLMNLLQESK